MVWVGLCWARVGTILGLSWAILGYVGTFWAMLAPYWAHAGPFWAIFGSVSAFVLDLGISMPLNFRPYPAFAKITKNTRKKCNLWTALLLVFAAIFRLFLFLSWGMQLGYVCLIGHSGLCRHHIGLMLGHSGVFRGFLPLLGKSWDHIGLILHHLGLCWAIVGYVGTILDILGSC